MRKGNEMADMRIAYQYHHLTEEAKKVAQKVAQSVIEGIKLDPSQFLYNEDGSKFEHSTTVQL